VKDKDIMKAQSTTTATPMSANGPITAVLLLSDRKLVGEFFAADDKANPASRKERFATRSSTRLTIPDEFDEDVFYPALYNR
jgi:hypothetical protein